MSSNQIMSGLLGPLENQVIGHWLDEQMGF